MTSSDKTNRLEIITLTGRVLGTLFYQEPNHPDNILLFDMFRSSQWVQEWPLASPALNEIASLMEQGINDPHESLKDAWQRLFIGPNSLPAPPWGSVWLDKESVLFGDSMLELRQWMRQHAIDPGYAQNEPDDHIGLLLMLAAWLAEQGQETLLDELLAWHLLPWFRPFIQQFISHAGHPFYKGLGELTRLTLEKWQEELLIPMAVKEIYFSTSAN